MTKHFGEQAATKAVITQNDLLRFTRMRLRDYEFTGIHSQIGETTGEVIEGIVLPLTVNSALIYDLKAIAIPHCGDSEFIHGVLFQHLQAHTTINHLLATNLMPLR